MKGAFRFQLAGALSIRATGVVLLFASNVVLARAMGVSTFGSYSVALAGVTLMAIPASAGLPTLVTREVARSRAQQNGTRFRQVVKFAGRATFGNALLAGAAGGVIWWGDWVLATSVVLIVALLALEQLRSAVMQGLGSGVLAQIPEAWVRPIALMIGIAGAHIIFHGEVTREVALAAYGLSLLASLFLGAAIARSLISKGVWKGNRETGFEVKSWLRSWARLGALGASQRTMGTLDLLVLGALSTTVDAAQYKIALQLAVIGALVQTSASPVVTAKLARIVSTQSPFEAKVFVRKVAMVLTAATTTVGLGIAVCSELIVEIAFGPGFGGVLPVVVPLLLSQLINAATGPCLSLLTLNSLEVDAMKGVILGLTVLIATAPFAAMQFGSVGVAYAVAFSNVVMNIALSYRVTRRLGFNPTIFAWRYRVR